MADACYAFLRETKKALATLPDDVPDGSAELFSQQIADYDAETQHQRDAGLLSRDALTTRLQVQAVLRRWEGELRRANAAGTQEAFELLRGQFQTLADGRETAQKQASAALEAAFDFMEQAFAESQEMVVFVTELTREPGVPMLSSPRTAASAISSTTRICCWTTAKLPCSRSWPLSSAATERVSHVGKCPVQRIQPDFLAVFAAEHGLHRLNET